MQLYRTAFQKQFRCCYNRLDFRDTYSRSPRLSNAHRRELRKLLKRHVLTPPHAATDLKAALAEVAAQVPKQARVLVAGSAELVAAVKAAGLEDVLAASTEPGMAQHLQADHPASSLGNDVGLRTWLGNLSSVPAYQGPFDAVFADDIGGNLRSTLLPAALLLKPGGVLAIAQAAEDVQPPRSEAALEEIIYDLPLRLSHREANGSASAVTVLQVPEGYTFSRAPIFVEEEVVTGFGRGSKQMGVPTANLRPEDLFAGPLQDLPLGVYFGWAQLQGASGKDGAVHKTVLNIGKRPSIEDGEQRTVELHIMHGFARDFYGERVKMAMVGFIRPEIKFDGLPSLINRINADKGLARTQLDLPQHAELATDKFFSLQ